ncbi:hypothetical protein BCEP4_2480008 [Burkholderia cepacia]|nr:hypothetical protein BCEP4_2480008 [Burkholderia cepacia]
MLVRAVDVRSRDDCTAVGRVVRQIVVRLREDRRGTAETDDTYPGSKQVAHDRLLPDCPRPLDRVAPLTAPDTSDC